MNKLFAFVLMPFDKKFDDTYRLGIKAAAEECGFFAERVDEQTFHNETILSRILNQIEVADIIIADLTDRNPNVFYEVGYAHAKMKTCILLTRSTEDIPFDLKHHRHIVYDGGISQLKDKLSTDLSSLKSRLNKEETSPTVRIHTDEQSLLEFTTYSAVGHLEIKIDIHASKSSGMEIEAMYFYTGGSWKFTQDGNECPYTDSDIPDFARRHMLKPPLSRVAKGGWAQAKIKGTRMLAWGKREALKDTYKISGRTAVRISTPSENLDFHQVLETEFSEMPF